MPASASRIQLGSGERRLLLLLSALVAFGPLSIDMYLPSLPAIAADLGASDAQVQRSISGFLVGFCVGMLFYGTTPDETEVQHDLLSDEEKITPHFRDLSFVPLALPG
ncbi:stress protection protein MarC, partial [Pseudomonas aeruginosa]|nr:stress protection protein MarC [Pseudomonas aeruginosa]